MYNFKFHFFKKKLVIQMNQKKKFTFKVNGRQFRAKEKIKSLNNTNLQIMINKSK